MDAKEAIETAKSYVGDLFSAEGTMNLGLEELKFDDVRHLWSVTIGFTRSWEGPQGLGRWTGSGEPLPRTFKTVEIDDASGRILGMRHWPVAA